MMLKQNTELSWPRLKGRSGDERTDVMQKVDVIIDLTEQLLVVAQKLSYWREASIRTGYFVAAKALICTRCPSEVVQRLGKDCFFLGGGGGFV